MLLSALPDDQIPAAVPAEPFPSFTENTMTTLADLRKDLEEGGPARVRARRQRAQRRACGASRCPVRVDGDCLAAVSVSGPAGEFSTAKQQVYVAALDEVAKAVTDDPDFVTALRIVHRSLRVAGRP